MMLCKIMVIRANVNIECSQFLGNSAATQPAIIGFCQGGVSSQC